MIAMQAAPYNSASLPLYSRAAWSRDETYTPGDVTGLVRYAHDRGVRVMMEVDTPGHSAAWGVGYPELLADCPRTMSVG